MLKRIFFDFLREKIDSTLTDIATIIRGDEELEQKFDDYCTTQYNLAKTKADGDLIHPIIHTGCKKRKASQKMALH